MTTAPTAEPVAEPAAAPAAAAAPVLPVAAVPLTSVPEVTARTTDGITTRTVIDPAEPCFAGHYPGFPILPGVLLIESVTQAVRLYTATRDAPHTGRVRLASIESVRFSAPALPGDVLETECRAAWLPAPPEGPPEEPPEGPREGPAEGPSGGAPDGSHRRAPRLRVIAKLRNERGRVAGVRALYTVEPDH